MLFKQYIIILTSSLLLACAASEERQNSDPTAVSSRGTDCISQGSIRDYKVLDDSNLIVSAGASRDYHVTLSRRAFGLRSSQRIGFQSRSGRICGGFDELVVDDGLGPERYRIASVRRLTPAEAENLEVRFGLREPEVVTPRQPQEVKGAEVEELD